MEPNLDLAVNASQRQRQDTQNLLGGQDARNSAFTGKLSSYVSNTPTQAAMAARIGSELGLPQLQSNASALQETVRNLPSTYSKATTGFDVNANQLARIVGTKQAELAPLAQRATEQQQTAEGELGRRLGYASEDFQRGLIPLSAEQSLLADRNARETTLYSQDNENELSSLINKIQNGITLSEAEKNRAHSLAMQEKEYENTRKLNEQSYGQKKDFFSYQMSQDPLGLFGS